MFVEAARYVRRNRLFASGVEVDPATMFGGSPGVGIRNPGTRFLVLMSIEDAYRLADAIVDAAERAGDMYEMNDTGPAMVAGR